MVGRSHPGEKGQEDTQGGAGEAHDQPPRSTHVPSLQDSKDVKKKLQEREKTKHKSRTKIEELELKEVEQTPSALYFTYNKELGPPYHILLDTNFINFSIQHKLDILRSMMDCLLGKCVPYVTDCVIGEL